MEQGEWFLKCTHFSKTNMKYKQQDIVLECTLYLFSRRYVHYSIQVLQTYTVLDKDGKQTQIKYV